jgi:DNA-binding MarR family transcriptional regulator
MKPEYIIFLISRIRERANKLIAQELKHHNLHGLCPSHGSILSALSRGDALPMRVLARMIDRDKSTVTILVDKLVALGYVEKSRDITDQRITLIKLTERGKALRPDLEDISRKLLATVYEGISEGEKQILIEILTKIKNNF